MQYVVNRFTNAYARFSIPKNITTTVLDINTVHLIPPKTVGYLPGNHLRQNPLPDKATKYNWKTKSGLSVALTIQHTSKDKLSEIVKAAYFFTNYFNHECNSSLTPDNVEIGMVLTRLKKTFPRAKGIPFDVDNINSGVTWLESGKATQMLVYRKEECIKVLIHELLHYFRLDSVVHESGNVKLTETWTESMAVILKTLWDISRHHKHMTIDMVKDKMDQQRRHVYLLADAVCDHYGMVDRWEYGVLTGRLSKIPFAQRTNVYEYVLLRALAMQNAHTLLLPWGKYGFSECASTFHANMKYAISKLTSTRRKKKQIHLHSFKMAR
jgi:hypothetical protein